ncbi:TonB-dependent receptor [Rhodocytophaga aerolata]|uniref:TonB-dependent receptor n=1 Tax=Rhodocytophaga aerolata TaxID=455078 RepID=A0ABT8R321_9BACT|nr:TonB-dependent receptor [Rhodocytophaga aerolata]MDO1445779.1 TonB-dependent receptor [Rhodocytophaga aerolata]
MNKLFAIFLFTFWATIAFAQTSNPGKLTGSLTDSTTAKPVPYVTVALMEGTKLLTGTTSEDDGTFVLANLPLGTYSLVLSYVGYRSKTVPVTLSDQRPVLDLGAIRMATESKALAEVTVSGQKDLVEDKGDRLVYNAEKDISNAGGTAADVLRKVPMLSVDLNGNVQMRGNGNIKVLINGKPSAMMARNLADALRQMPANTIKSVEVITNPGARYDAEGSAGVINIITKKALQGFSGTVNATAGNFNQGIGTSLNAKKGKFGLSLSANGYQYRNIREGESVRTTLFNGQPVNTLTQSNFMDNTGRGGYGEMSFDYDPDSTSRFNLALNIWGGNFPNDSRVINRLTDPAGAELQSFGNAISFYNPYGNGQMDVGYTKTFKKAGQEFSLLGQYSRMPDNYFYDTDRFALSVGETILSRQRSNNYSRNKEYTVQTDYTHPFKRNGRKDTTEIKVEVGLKSILRDIGSEFRVEESADGVGPLVPVPAQSNDFNYVQRVYSGYTSLRIDTKRKWGLSIGARLEHTDIDGDFVTTRTTLSNNYTNLIPSFTLSKGIKTHTFKISYTQRIQRPLIWYLNPWINEADTLNKFTGNPYLDPELNHSPEISYSTTTKKGLSINSSLYYRLTDNAIEYISTVTEEGSSLTKPQNIAKRESYGLNLNLSGQPNKDWNMNGGADMQYIYVNSPGLNQQNSGIIWSVNLNTTYKLPKDFTLQANGNFNSGWINLQGKYSGFYWYGISAKREFWSKKASLTLGINNPFNRGVWQEGRQAMPTFQSTFTSLYVTRSIRLTFEWRFGQMEANGGGKRSKKISNDDKGGR